MIMDISHQDFKVIRAIIIDNKLILTITAAFKHGWNLNSSR